MEQQNYDPVSLIGRQSVQIDILSARVRELTADNERLKSQVSELTQKVLEKE